MARGTGVSLTHLHVLECPPPWYSDIDATLLSSLVDVALMKEHRQAQLNSYLGHRLQDRRISPRCVFYRRVTQRQRPSRMRRENK